MRRTPIRIVPMTVPKLVSSDELAFEAGVFLLRKATAEALRAGTSTCA
jgi:hypothetical protein